MNESQDLYDVLHDVLQGNFAKFGIEIATDTTRLPGNVSKAIIEGKQAEGFELIGFDSFNTETYHVMETRYVFAKMPFPLNEQEKRSIANIVLYSQRNDEAAK